ncbi:MAG: fumarylacetoacetate hydrolase family protein [Firmicutes bacterium]|nr:fumarylacetoacetate hydrolase family protein [Bacillota bacterium]
MQYLSRQTVLGERLQFVYRVPGKPPQILDFARCTDALGAVARERGEQPTAHDCMPPSAVLPHTLMDLFASGEKWWTYSLQVERLCREYLSPASIAACVMPGEPLPVIPRPPSVRDFYAFETHVKRARARRGLEMVPEWYDFPVFYFSNPCALLADGAVVKKPVATRKLDFELEVAVIVRRPVRDVSPSEALTCLAGLTILNDWSARDIQAQEVKVGLGPAKGKDFATSLGPVLVTFDELASRVSDLSDGHGPRIDLPMRAYVNGDVITTGNLSDLHYTIGDLVARASSDVTLYPGEVLGTGTVGGGCLLEWGEDAHRWLDAGDEVKLEVEAVGALTNRIG